MFTAQDKYWMNFAFNKLFQLIGLPNGYHFKFENVVEANANANANNATQASDVTTRTVVCTSDMSVGDVVFINNDVAIKASPTSLMVNIGVVIEKLETTQAVVQFNGIVDVFSNLIPNKIYYLSSNGTISNNIEYPPHGEKNYVQCIGVSIDSTSLMLIKPNCICVLNNS